MRAGILVIALVAATLAGATPISADDKAEGPPPLTFHNKKFIERADGTVIYFYRVDHVAPNQLSNQLSEVLRDKKLGMRVLQHQNALVLDGLSDQVEAAVAAIAYLDVPSPQVLVEVKVERVTRTKAESGVDGSVKAGTVSELVSRAELLVVQGATAEATSREQEARPVLSESRSADTITRTTSMRSGFRVKLLALHIGATNVTLQVEPELNGLREPTAMRTALGTPIETMESTRTTIAAKDGQSVVIARIQVHGAFQHDGIDLTRAPPAQGTTPISGRAGSTETEIVITVTPRIVVAPPAKAKSKPVDVKDDAGK